MNSTTTVDLDLQGISIEGFRTLIAGRPNGETIGDWWNLHGVKVTLPHNFTTKDLDPRHETEEQRLYKNLTTGEWAASCPAGMKTIYELMFEDGRGEHVKPATHFLSYPTTAPFAELIDALEITVRKYEQETQKKAYIYLWLGHNAHNSNTPEQWILNLTSSIHKLDGGLLCANLDWRKPTHLSRLWMLFEAYCAVAYNVPLSLVLCSSQSRKLANYLRDHGPETILHIVAQLEALPEKAKTLIATDKQLFVAAMYRLSQKKFPNSDDHNHMMSQALANITRQAYAEAADYIYRIDISDASSMTNIEFLAKTVDLGHQIANLYAITGNYKRAEEIYLEILPLLPVDVIFSNLPDDINKCQTDRQREILRYHKFAARDTTVAALAMILRIQNKHHVADNTIKLWLNCELPLSFNGVSVSFLEKFIENHEKDINFLSTNATVERLIKPMTKNNGSGRAFIEQISKKYIGSKDFNNNDLTTFIFISHAWIQNFNISGDIWKGGLLQSIIGNTQPNQKASTYIWLDIFSINQHNPAMAFSFQPLRNVVKDVDKVCLFFQTWEDSLPLTRVWCLEELHNAILFGKEVMIMMPPGAKKSFQQIVRDSPNIVHTTEYFENFQSNNDQCKCIKCLIETVVFRIDIRFANATIYKDKLDVFNRLKESIGANALNIFLQDVIRSALYTVGHIHLTTNEKEKNAQRRNALFIDLLNTANELPDEKFAKRIEIKRAVALMRLRTYDNDASFTGTSRSRHRNSDPGKWNELEQLIKEAIRYYGQSASIVRDLRNVLPPISSSKRSVKEEGSSSSSSSNGGGIDSSGGSRGGDGSIRVKRQKN
jgi:uncharacterized membrane protein YgcG